MRVRKGDFPARQETAAGPPPEKESQGGAEKGPVRRLLDLLLTVLGAFCFVLLLQFLLLKPFAIPSGSMLPSLQPGDRVLVERLSARLGEPKLGQIVVFTPPADYLAGCPEQEPGQACPIGSTRGMSKTTFVKRIVGLPGDVLMLKRGVLWRNGKPVREPWTSACPPQIEGCDLPVPLKVKPGYFYVMGDNRSASFDSRFWGPVPRAGLIGHSFFRYWPLTRIGRTP